MKKIPMFFQVFIYMMALTLVLLLVVFVIQREVMPMIYQQQRQFDMHEEIVEINSLLKNADTSLHENIVNNFNQRTTYDLYVYDIFGKALFGDNTIDLRTSTIIELNQKPIENEYFDGLIPYVLRIEKTDLYIYQLSIPTEGLYQTIRAIDSLYVYIVIIGLAVSTLTSFIFSRNLSKPINTLKKMSESLGEKSLLIHRDDEIGALSKTLESLRVSLYKTIHDLERELEREKKQDTISKQFIANVSHEYQTPLAVMLAAIETLMDHDELDKTDRDKYFYMIEKEAKHLEQLSKDILLLSKTHVIEASFESNNLDDITKEVVSQFTLIDPSVHVEMNMPKKAQTVYMKTLHLKQILNNVIHNAMRHQDNGLVFIEVGIDQKGVYISVENQTSTLTQDDLAHIMDPFYKKVSQGHGLGLAIVKNLLSVYPYHYSLSLKEHIFSFTIHFWSRTS